MDERRYQNNVALREIGSEQDEALRFAERITYCEEPSMPEGIVRISVEEFLK